MMFRDPDFHSLLLPRGLRRHPRKHPMRKNPCVSRSTLSERRRPQRKPACSITVVLGAALGTLESFSIPGSLWVSNGLVPSNPVVSAQEDSVSSELMALKPTAYHNTRLSIPNWMIKCGKNGCSTQTFKRWRTFLNYLNVELREGPYSMDALRPRKRSASAGGTSSDVKQEAVPPKMVKRAGATRPEEKPGSSCSSLQITRELVQLPVQDISVASGNERPKIQHALADLQKTLQKATTNEDGLPLLTPLELQTLVIGSHVRSLVPEIVTELKVTYTTSKTTLQALERFQNLLSIYSCNILFPEQKWASTTRKNSTVSHSMRFTEVTPQDVEKCIELTTQHIRESTDTLQFLSTVLSNRKNLKDGKSVSTMVREALEIALPRYREVLSATISRADIYRLCTLFQVAMPPAPALMLNRPLLFDATEYFCNDEKPYRFWNQNIVNEVAESLAALSRGAVILQLLRLVEDVPAIAEGSECQLVALVENHFKRIPDQFFPQGHEDCKRFRKTILKNGYARQCLEILYPEYLEFSEEKLRTQMLHRFRTVINTVDLHLNKLVGHAMLCSILIKKFENIYDLTAKEIVKRLQEYGKEVFLAFSLIDHKVLEMQKQSRKPIDAFSAASRINMLHREKEHADRKASFPAVQLNSIDSQASVRNQVESLPTAGRSRKANCLDYTKDKAAILSSVDDVAPIRYFSPIRAISSGKMTTETSCGQSDCVPGLNTFASDNTRLTHSPSLTTMVLPGETAPGTSSQDHGISSMGNKTCAGRSAFTVTPRTLSVAKKKPLSFFDLAALKYRIHKMVKNHRQTKQCDSKNIWRPF